MKLKFYLLILGVVICALDLRAQCNDVYFTSQADVDAFKSRGCTALGYAQVSGNDITNLDSLSDLTSIQALLIENNPNLKSINLSSLATLDGNLRIIGNPKLKNLDGLTALTTIHDALILYNNDSLESIQGLSNLATVDEDIEISYLPRLASLAGLGSLTTAPLMFAIHHNDLLQDLSGLALNTVGTLMIEHNASLTNLHGLETLTAILDHCACARRGLVITNNPMLADVIALSHLTSVSGMVQVINNPVLTNVEGFAGLTHIGGNFEFGDQGIDIENNAMLSTINGFGNVSGTIGSLIVTGNDALVNLDGLGNLTAISGRGITIDSNRVLQNINALSRVERVTSGLRIRGNDALQSMDGLRSLTAVGTPKPYISTIVDISNNASLQNVDSLYHLTAMGADVKDLNLVNNPGLTKGCGLYPLLNELTTCTDCGVVTTTISGNGAGVTKEKILAGGPCGPGPVTCDGDIILSTQADVDSFASTHPCTVIAGNLMIEGSDITNLDGLTQITKVGGLWINNCLQLTDVSGLSSLQRIDGLFYLINDPSLTSTHGFESLTFIGSWFLRLQRDMDLTGFSNLQTINGNFELEGNAIGNLHGLENLEKIVGQLQVSDDSGLVNLEGLSGVKHIGSMDIFGNHTIESLGLASLESLGPVRVYNNQELRNFDGMGPLTTTGELNVFENPKLMNIDGLSSVTTVGGRIRFSENPMLTSLAGLASVVTINGGLIVNGNAALTDLGIRAETIGGAVVLTDNENLENLNGFSDLKTIGSAGCSCAFSGLLIRNQPKLASIDLSSLTSIGGALIIDKNPLITDLNTLTSLTHVGVNTDFGDQSISISSNTALTTIEGLQNLSGDLRGSLSIYDNASLVSLKGLEKITDVGESLVISGNASLTNIDALSKIRSSSYELTITYNPLIEDLNGLASFTSLDGKENSTVRISNNAMLTNVDSLSKFTSQSTPKRDLIVANNPNLTRGCGLYPLIDQSYNSCQGCTPTITMSGNGPGFSRAEIEAGGPCDGVTPVTCGGTIQLDSQAEIDAFPATHGCSIINGRLSISGADITNVDSLYQITTVIGQGEGQLWGVLIQGNPLLENLNGLHSLTTIGRYSMLMVTDNASLTSLEGLSALDSVGKAYNYGNYGVDIENNPALTSVKMEKFRKSTGVFVVRNNPALADLSGVENMVETGGLTIVTNNSLVSVDGLSGLTKTSGIYIGENPVLENLDGLQGLEHIWNSPAAGLNIINNASLTNVDGLKDFADISGPDRRLVVTNNPNLTRGCGFYNLLNTNFCEGCPGSVTFSGNGPGVTKAEIIAAGPCDGDNEAGPSAPANLAFSNVTDNSMTVSFEKGERAVGYITVMRAFESALPDEAPVDGTYDYHIGNVIGCCTIIVGLGNDTTLNIVYLEPDIDYYFDIIPYTLVNGLYNFFPEQALSGYQRTNPGVQPYPNPFVEEVTIPFTVVEESSNVRIIISDQLGRPVSELVNDQYGMGKHEVRWGRIDLNGNRVTEGVYMYSITTNGSEPVKGLFVAK